MTAPYNHQRAVYTARPVPRAAHRSDLRGRQPMQRRRHFVPADRVHRRVLPLGQRQRRDGPVAGRHGGALDAEPHAQQPLRHRLEPAAEPRVHRLRHGHEVHAAVDGHPEVAGQALGVPRDADPDLQAALVLQQRAQALGEADAPVAAPVHEVHQIARVPRGDLHEGRGVGGPGAPLAVEPHDAVAQGAQATGVRPQGGVAADVVHGAGPQQRAPGRRRGHAVQAAEGVGQGGAEDGEGLEVVRRPVAGAGHGTRLWTAPQG